MSTVARRFVRIAARVLPPARAEWGAAMGAELEALPRGESRLGFALGCLRGAAIERMVMFADNPWRVARWAAAALLLCVPAVAMRFDSGVEWTTSDFVVMGAMLLVALLGYEALVGRGAGFFQRAGSALTVAGSFLLLWINLAVGIIGSEHNGANWMYVGVLALVVGGAIAARLRPSAMARVMLAAAAAQVLIAAIAVIGRLGGDEAAWPYDTLGVTALFTALWLAAAWLFARSASAKPAVARG